MRARALGLLLALGVLLPLALSAPAAAAPAAAPARAQATVRTQAAGALPVSVLVSDLRPRAPRPGGDLQVLGALVNTGPDRLRDLQVRVRVGSRLIRRGQLRLADAIPPATFPRRDLPLGGDLAPGRRLDLDVRVRVDDLRLGADGVYPLQLEVRALRGASAVPVVVGSVGTALPWFGDREVDPLRIAWVWPLVDEPRLTPREDLLDDELAEQLAADGRLGRSLRAGRAGETGQCPAAAQAPSGRRSARRAPPP